MKLYYLPPDRKTVVNIAMYILALHVFALHVFL